LWLCCRTITKKGKEVNGKEDQHEILGIHTGIQGIVPIEIMAPVK
jgi:hypothetical protein